MTDGLALLHAVIDEPEDDASRLVYADWLDENGDPDRAEFIRAQVRLAGMDLWEERYTAIDVRCRQLERAHPEWLGPLEPFVSRCERFCGDRDRPFDRGFPARVELTPEQFAKHRHYLLDETPVRDVQVLMENATRKLARVPGLARLTGVEIAYARDPVRVRNALACLGRLGALTHFGLIGSILSEQDAGEVFASPAVGEVQSLAIMGTVLHGPAEATFASLDWPNLRRLVRVWVPQVDWLRSPWVGQLEELTIYDTEPNLSAGQTRLLAEVLPQTAVRQLRLGWWSMDVPGGQALGEAVARSRVRSLAVAQTHLSADVARALLTPALLAQLHAIYFSGATLDADIVARLPGSRLRVCALDHMTVESLAGLCQAPGLPELADLRLGLVARQPDDPFGERLRQVLEAGTLPHLMSLTVCDTTPRLRAEPKVNGDQIALALASCPASATLRELHLDNVSGTGASALGSSPYLDDLQLLNVGVWPEDKGAEWALTQRFGGRAYLGFDNREF